MVKRIFFKTFLLSISLGNQRLDFQEFVAFMSKHWHERDQEAELREAFRLFDRDNSGYITINELKQVEIIKLTFRKTFIFFLSFKVMLNMGEKLNQEELEDMMREVDIRLSIIVVFKISYSRLM